MKVGTKSLLFGVHQFVWHPVTVWIAWTHLYGLPSWRECVCIVIHDWGYWGCGDMDGREGSRHPALGAKIAGRLFGPKFDSLVGLHSRRIAQRFGLEPSKLCWADKLSMRFDPTWFYLLRSRLTGELSEYRRGAHNEGFCEAWRTDRHWHAKLVAMLEMMCAEKAAAHSDGGYAAVPLPVRETREVLEWVAWGMQHFSGLAAGNRRGELEALAKAGLVKCEGCHPVCDDDGFLKDPEEYDDCYVLTAAGRSFLDTINDRKISA